MMMVHDITASTIPLLTITLPTTMKTPLSSGKKKKKISGVSPSMDLTRFGFSVKKRYSSEAASSPPKSVASAKRDNNNAGKTNEDDNNLESPLKRQKFSSTAAKNDIGSVASGNKVAGKGKGKENGIATSIDCDNEKPSQAATTTAAAASRTALYDLTQSSSSEENPSNKKEDRNAAVGSNDVGGGAAKIKLQEANFESIGGLASSIANQIVSASSLRGNMGQQQQQPSVKQRRGKRDKIIPSNKKSNATATKSIEPTKFRSSAIATSTTTKTSSSAAKSLSPTKNKSGNISNNIQALALVRVIDPHEITCSTAVANARRQDQKQQQNITKQQPSWTPRRIFNGAILGRSSSSANAKPNFVDLGVSNMCKGVSRNHITVLNVRVTTDSTTMVQESPNRLSQTSAASSSTKSSAAIQSEQSTVTLQVSENASNGITVHRSRRGSRKVAFLTKGEKMTLRVGDAIEFYSDEKLYYCVVGLESVQDETKVRHVVRPVFQEQEVVVLEEEKKPTEADTTTTKKRVSYGGSINGDEKKRNPTKLNVTDEVEIIDEKKQPKIGVNNGRTTSSTTKSASSIAEIEDTPIFSTSTTSPTSHVKSATETTVAKCIDKKLQKSPMGPKSPIKSTVSDKGEANVATLDPTVDDLESPKTKDDEEEEESEMIKKGDLVKAGFDVTDPWFGITLQEWYFGTVSRVKKEKISSSTPAYKIDVLYADKSKGTLPFPADDVEKADGHVYPDTFFVGDSVDCLHQDGHRPGHEGKWYRGRISSISDDGSTCDVLYLDQDVSSLDCEATFFRVIMC